MISSDALDFDSAHVVTPKPESFSCDMRPYARSCAAVCFGVYSRRPRVAQAPQIRTDMEWNAVKPDELKKLDAYFKRTLNPNIVVKARPRKNDSAEVYIGEEFLGVIYKDEEDGDLSYNFSMAILDVDL
jgi:hypothetical protein